MLRPSSAPVLATVLVCSVACGPSAPQSPPLAWIPPATLTTCPTRGVDPVQTVLTQNLSTTGDAVVTHLLAVEADGAWLHAVGTGGYFLATSSDLTPSGHWGELRNASSTLQHLAVLDDRLVATSSRAEGLFFLDPLDPEGPRLVAQVDHDDIAGLAAGPAGHLWALGHDGVLTSYDLSEPTAPTVLATQDTGASAWTLSIRDTLAYIGHDTGRLSVVDLTSAADPQPRGVTELRSGIHDLTASGDHLYAALGTAGLEILSLSDPSAPTSVGHLPLPPPVLSLDARDHTLWATNHDGVLVLDLDDPAQPTLKGWEHTAQWSMDVVAHDGGAFVADWQRLLLLDDAPDTCAPILVVPHEVQLADTSATLPITNLGATLLAVTEVTSADPRLRVAPGRTQIVPGGQVALSLTFEDDGAPLDTTLTLHSDDPDRPTHDIPVRRGAVGSNPLAVGMPAPDFVLPGLDGQTHRLSEQLGGPVLLSYFATW